MSNGDRLAWRLLHAVSQFDASQEPTLWIGDEHEDGTRTPAMAIWSSGEYLPDVMARLVDAMQQNGEYPGDHGLDTTTLVGDLLNTVEVAIKARDGASGSTGIGGVAEVLNSEWVLTERGWIASWSHEFTSRQSSLGSLRRVVYARLSTLQFTSA